MEEDIISGPGKTSIENLDITDKNRGILLHKMKRSPSFVGQEPFIPISDKWLPGGYNKKYDKNLTEADLFDVENFRAVQQSGGRALANSVVQLVGSTLGEVVASPMSLAQLVMDTNELEDTVFSLFRDAGDFVSDISRESAPVYTGEGYGRDVFNPFSSEWWAKSVSQFGPTIAMMVLSMYTAGVTTPALLRSLEFMSSAIPKFDKYLQLAKTFNAESKFSKNFAQLNAAVTSRALESGMEAWNHYEIEKDRISQLESLKPEEERMSEEEISLMAGKSASDVWSKNWRLLLLDYMQFKGIMSGFGVFSKESEKAFLRTMSKPTGVALEIASESVEEGYQYYIDREASTYNNNLLGIPDLKYGKDILYKIGQYIEDPNMQEAMVQGALGGALFSGVGSIMDKAVTSRMIKESMERYGRRRELVNELNNEQFESLYDYAFRGDLQEMLDNTIREQSSKKREDNPKEYDYIETMIHKGKSLLEIVDQVNSNPEYNSLPDQVKKRYIQSIFNLKEDVEEVSTNDSEINSLLAEEEKLIPDKNKEHSSSILEYNKLKMQLDTLKRKGKLKSDLGIDMESHRQELMSDIKKRMSELEKEFKDNNISNTLVSFKNKKLQSKIEYNALKALDKFNSESIISLIENPVTRKDVMDFMEKADEKAYNKAEIEKIGYLDEYEPLQDILENSPNIKSRKAAARRIEKLTQDAENNDKSPKVFIHRIDRDSDVKIQKEQLNRMLEDRFNFSNFLLHKDLKALGVKTSAEILDLLDTEEGVKKLRKYYTTNEVTRLRNNMVSSQKTALFNAVEDKDSVTFKKFGEVVEGIVTSKPENSDGDFEITYGAGEESKTILLKLEDLVFAETVVSRISSNPYDEFSEEMLDNERSTSTRTSLTTEVERDMENGKDKVRLLPFHPGIIERMEKNGKYVSPKFKAAVLKFWEWVNLTANPAGQSLEVGISDMEHTEESLRDYPEAIQAITIFKDYLENPRSLSEDTRDFLVNFLPLKVIVSEDTYGVLPTAVTVSNRSLNSSEYYTRLNLILSLLRGETPLLTIEGKSGGILRLSKKINNKIPENSLLELDTLDNFGTLEEIDFREHIVIQMGDSNFGVYDTEGNPEYTPIAYGPGNFGGESGLVYLVVKDRADQNRLVKLNTSHVNNEDANIVIHLLELASLASTQKMRINKTPFSKISQLYDSELSGRILKLSPSEMSTLEFAKEILRNMDPNYSLKNLIEFFVKMQYDETKNSHLFVDGQRIKFATNRLEEGDRAEHSWYDMNLNNLTDDFLKTYRNKLRKFLINQKRYNFNGRLFYAADPAYSKYIIEKKILNTDATTDGPIFGALRQEDYSGKLDAFTPGTVEYSNAFESVQRASIPTLYFNKNVTTEVSTENKIPENKVVTLLEKKYNTTDVRRSANPINIGDQYSEADSFNTMESGTQYMAYNVNGKDVYVIKSAKTGSPLIRESIPELKKALKSQEKTNKQIKDVYNIEEVVIPPASEIGNSTESIDNNINESEKESDVASEEVCGTGKLGRKKKNSNKNKPNPKEPDNVEDITPTNNTGIRRGK